MDEKNAKSGGATIGDHESLLPDDGLAEVDGGSLSGRAYYYNCWACGCDWSRPCGDQADVPTFVSERCPKCGHITLPTFH